MWDEAEYYWLVCVTLLQCFSSPAQPRFIQTTHRHPAGATRHPHGEPEESLDLCSGLGGSSTQSWWTIQYPGKMLRHILIMQFLVFKICYFGNTGLLSWIKLKPAKENMRVRYTCTFLLN